MSSTPKPRLAICVSGQMRGQAEALPALADLGARWGADIIVSVWDKPGRKLDGAVNYHQLERIFSPIAQLAIPSRWLGSERLWAALPEARRMLTAADGADTPDTLRRAIKAAVPEAIVDVEPGELLDLDFHPRRNDLHSKRMFYKIWRAEEIRRRREAEHGPYDLILRMRPDVVFMDDLNLGELTQTPNLVLVDGYRAEDNAIGDFFAIAAPPVIDIYAATFARTIAAPFRFKGTNA